MSEIHSKPLKPKRRPRYRGTHPRQFMEKYKELNPLVYPEETLKIIDGGKTPAGTHRAICVEEILKIMTPKAGETMVDATLGFGGHAQALLEKLKPNGKLIGFDLDRLELSKTLERLRSEGFDEDCFQTHHSNYSEISEKLNLFGLTTVNGVVADLGMSSMQIDDPARGFSYKISGPLDMRLDPLSKKTAADLIKTSSERVLTAILEKNGDELFAPEIAKSIVENRRRKEILTTDDLVNVINLGLRSVPLHIRKTLGDKSLRRTFQALRIAVNEEFRALDLFLAKLPEVLAPGGRVAILTFHSGEDRRVKKAFQNGLRLGLYGQIAREVTRPSAQEIYSNPRSSSAKLRWAIKRT